MAGVGRFYVWEIHHFSGHSHRGSQVFITQVFVLVFLHSRCPLQGKHIRDHGDEFAVVSVNFTFECLVNQECP